jgi:Tfp pilus assembly protein FimT
MSLAVLILGIMSVFSYVKLRPVLEHSKVNGAVAVVASDLQYAQFLAARQRTPIVVIVTPATKSYVIRDRADATRIFRTRYLDSNTDYSLDSLSATSASMVIFANGITSASVTFTPWLNGYSRQVKFTKAGQIRILNGP